MSAAPAVDRTREDWAAGDYQRVGVRLVPAAEQLAADLAVRPGDRVLDVAGGTGNAALAAARRDGDPAGATGDPLRWGTADGVEELLGRGEVRQVRHAERTVDMTAPSLAAQWQRYRDWSAPVHVAWQRLDPAGRAALEADSADLWGSSPRGGGPGIVVPNTYLQTTAVRAG